VLLDDPLPQKPSLRRILLAVLQATQSFCSQLENTGAAWSLKPDYTLAVANGSSDYLLAIDDSYGKPVQVLTYWPANLSIPQRYVEFREFQDMNFDWGWPVNVASFMYTDGSPNTAMRMAFYYKDDGTRWVRVLPQPQLSGGSYLITFASGDWSSNASLETSPVLSQFHSLIELWAAQSALPSCQWSHDQKYNMDHRRELMAALKNDQSRIQPEFDQYVRNLVDDHMGYRESSLDNDWTTGGWN
jgi:hypothetical protein